MTEFRFPHRVGSARLCLDSLDALIVSHLENVRYLTGFSGSNGLIVLTQSVALFFTDGRYAVQAGREVTGFEQIVLPPGTALLSAAGDWLQEHPELTQIGFESDHLPYSAFLTLEQATPTKTLLPRSGDIETVRALKDREEIGRIRAACQLADACFEHLCGFVKTGRTEAQVAWELEAFFRTHGAQKLSFDPIVGSGPNAALIHGRASQRVLGESGGAEFVLMDFGCVLDGYCSDITRTVVVGGAPTEPMQAIYKAVLAAQLGALAALKPGVEGKAVDAQARDVLRAVGYGEMPHGLGHGLGRIVHDLPLPALSPKATLTLVPGMVVTVEPGVYVEGLGGVRIEDDVLITDQGCERLTLSDKALRVL